ncbi:MAG TPA: cytochrome P450, partial [Alphaproteobacteria bacterium]|nr:cytochrome P450 [Alphaproteobacteria bacterium]HCO90578.1 cytochrome P450 [Alphaproteobacteria bacterium]
MLSHLLEETVMSAEMIIEEDVSQIPIDEIDVSNPKLFQQDVIGDYFKRMREEAPVHYCADGHSGPFWSVTKFNDIVRVDTDHKNFSSESTLGGIVLDDINQRPEVEDFRLPMFIAMDPP